MGPGFEPLITHQKTKEQEKFLFFFYDRLRVVRGTEKHYFVNFIGKEKTEQKAKQFALSKFEKKREF